MDEKFYTAERSQQIIISLLKAHGIRKVIASPGTTNLTLVASLQYDPYFEMYSSVDERSAAYLACGMAEESGEPVVITCTGATASRNYLPGLTEAYYRKLPVLAITANQGIDKVGHLVAQNIDRAVLPNDVAVLSVHISACQGADDEWNAEVLANRAMLELRRHGGGPVHINLSTTYSKDFSVKELPPVRVIRRTEAGDAFPALPDGRIAIFVGSHKPFTEEETAAIDNFCATHDAVVFCDHTSGYYGRYRVQFALVVGQRRMTSPLCRTDLLIHIGDVSGDYYSIGIGYRAKQVWRVSQDGEIRDTFRKLTRVFEMREDAFFRHYAGEARPSQYLEDCRATYQHYLAELPELPFSNIYVARHTASLLPPDCVLHLGILHSLRSWDFFELPRSVRSNSNVGGFGIDGDISSLIGASLIHPEKLYFIALGDLAFFYDMNVLGNRHVGNNVRILLINNARGTEFRNYSHPGHAFGDAADPYIAAAGHYGNASPHLVRHYAQDLGYEYSSARTKEEYQNVVTRFLTPEHTDRPMLLEVFTAPQEESDAMEMALNYIVPEQKESSAAKKAIKAVLGVEGVKLVKGILGR